jgi:hypothetical protein
MLINAAATVADVCRLAEKIRAARVNKERSLQLQEKAALAAQEAEHDRVYDKVSGSKQRTHRVLAACQHNQLQIVILTTNQVLTTCQCTSCHVLRSKHQCVLLCGNNSDTLTAENVAHCHCYTKCIKLPADVCCLCVSCRS